MRVSRLKIKNFRGIKDGAINFGGHSVLIGPNNSGKTTIIEALALVFGRDRMIRELTEHDFFGSDPSPTDRIQLIATITGFEPNEPENHPGWFSPDRAVPKWINPVNGEIRSIPEEHDWPLCAQLGFAARFDHDELCVESIRFFVDSEDDLQDVFDEQHYQSAPWEAVKEFGFFLISGSRTWDRMMSFASELFRRVVSTIGGLPAEALLGERDRLRNPILPLEQQAGLKDVVDAANSELSRLLSNSPTLSLRLTGTDSAAILNALTPHFSDKAGNSVPASRQGTGVLSLQSMLLLLQFGSVRAKAGQGFCLGVEEPELHIPPAQQRRLINRIQALCTQTIASTHSPDVASMYSTNSVIFLRNSGGELTATPLAAAPLSADTSNPIQKLFYVNRTRTIAGLMHQVVLVPEGRTDYGWLSYLSTAVELQEPWNSSVADGIQFGTFVGVIPTNDSHVVQTYSALQSVHNRVCCVVDGDGQGSIFINQLLAQDTPPPIIVTWPEAWSIESIVAWIVEADPDIVLPRISTVLGVEIVSSSELAESLRGPFKHWDVMHEAIANEISVCSATRERTNTFLVQLTEALTSGAGSPDSLFEQDLQLSTHGTKVIKLTP